MTAEQLRNSILQEAISGRLVPQDPNDEPAAVLLARIREEKAQLVKEGKLNKKDLVETPITEEEIPFEIPASWEWVRLGYLVDFSKSSSVKASSISPNAWILDLEDIQKNTGVLLRKKRMGETVSISDKHQFKKGNVLYSKLRPYLNKVIVADEDGYCTSEILCFNFGEINNRYAQLFLMSAFFVDYAMKDAYGVKMPRLGSKQGNNALFPLPPLAEQKRIVAKLEELLPIVEQYGKAQKELDELNAALPARLRQSILQEAIQGKLTEHDLEDNWAKVYCEKLPKLKYKSSPEWPQEYPFELPENWEWCRIGDICELMNGYAFKSTQYKETGVRVIRITNVQDGYIVDNNPKFYPQIPDIERYVLKEGDLLMSLTGNVGRVGILPQSMLPAALNQRVACLRLKDERLKPFLFWYLRCPIFRERCEDSGHGMAQLNISTEWVKQEYIPLPPLAEQKRIVAKIEELFVEIDKLK